jgi:hypothetical protein
MEKNNHAVSVYSVSLKYAGLFCVIAIAFSIIPKILGSNPNADWLWSVLSMIIFVVIVVLAHRYFKERGIGFMTFGQGFVIGLLISVITALVTSVFTYVYFKLIDPTVLAGVLDQSIEIWESSGLTDDQIEMFSGLLSPGFISSMLFISYSFGGLLISLIIPIFTQKENPDPFA